MKIDMIEANLPDLPKPCDDPAPVRANAQGYVPGKMGAQAGMNVPRVSCLHPHPRGKSTLRLFNVRI